MTRPLVIIACFVAALQSGWFAGSRSSAQTDSSDRAENATPLYSGLGNFHRAVTTVSPDAQDYFNQGLCFLYAFNHDEAIRSFGMVIRHDPSCAMALWGMALANGPHINNPMMTRERSKAAWQAIQQAKRHVEGTQPVERDLIRALDSRYAWPPPEDRAVLDRNYADAMRKVWYQHPQDPDVGALFAEALMDLRPWDLWGPDGRPHPGTLEILSTLERVRELHPDHPLALHLTVHGIEGSQHPEWASESADRLRDLQPGLGHLLHMPSHIDVRLGHWKQAIATNQKAVQADDEYRRKSPTQDFYRIYMSHNRHMMTYAAMMVGQSELAIDTISEMVRAMPSDWVKENAALADGFSAIPLEVLMRFGRWKEILAIPEPPEYLPFSRCLRHSARGVALAAQRNVEGALREQAEFLAAKDGVAEDAKVGNNKAHAILAVAEQLLAGEILYRQGKVEQALDALRTAVALEDELAYDEPPDWINPVRHALGATLLTEKRAAEAESVFREDLRRLPHNGWALFGLARSLELQGKQAEAAPIQAEFLEVWSGADLQIDSPCMCQSAAAAK